MDESGIPAKPRYSVAECLELLGVSRKHFYAQVKAGRYKIVKDGSRTFMTRADLLAAAKGCNNADTANTGANEGTSRDPAPEP